jgi:hypothetical protein
LSELPSAEDLERMRDNEKREEVEAILLNTDEYGEESDE